MKALSLFFATVFGLALGACGGGDGGGGGGFGTGASGGAPTGSCFDDCTTATGDMAACTAACSTGTGTGGAAAGTGGAPPGTGGGIGTPPPGGEGGESGGTFGPGGCGPIDTTSACSQPPGPGAQLPPPPPPYSGGACPPLQAWDVMTRPYNTITGGRQFIIVEPANPCPGEVFPVVFAWHWISGEAADFVDSGALQTVADEERILFVVPEAKGAIVPLSQLGISQELDTQWPFDVLQTPARMEEEFRFFDDMLACVTQHYQINTGCVGSVGISAGGLFNSQLLQARSHLLSSAVVLSGGVGELVKPWVGAAHKMPALVLWGGPADNFGGVFNFDIISRNLSNSLGASGHFVVECVHSCGHVPPLLAPGPDGSPGITPLIQFFKEHPYWLPDGASPYQGGLPASFPAWCGVGPGSGNPAMPHSCPGGITL